MTEESNVQPDVDDQPLAEVSELDALKTQAKILGISFHPNIGMEKLKAKIENALDDDTDDDKDVKKQKASSEIAAPGMTEDEYRKSRKQSARRRALALVRVRVSCLNPDKREWEGEIFSTGSAKLGTIKKYVPFNSDEGYHVPNIIYEMIKERKCTVYKNVRDARGNQSKEGTLINEFAIEVMDPLTPEEVKDLAQQQAMSGSID